MDKLPAKYISKLRETQDYHKSSDFYASNHNEDDFGVYSACSGDRGSLLIAPENVGIISASDSGALQKMEETRHRKIDIKTVGKFSHDLDMEFVEKPYIPPSETSLFANVDPSKPLITTQEQLQAHLDAGKNSNINDSSVMNVRTTTNIWKIDAMYHIDKVCYESYPCQHKVSYDGGFNWEQQYGVDIANWCKSNGYAIPAHFQEYSSWI